MNQNSKPANSKEEAADTISKATGLSHNDAMALLTQASEVETTDRIALECLSKNKRGESNTTKLNQVNDEVHLSRNGPPGSY